ncbi:MAG: 3'-5'-exoribonuclease [Chrysothrix sp. TS-e1954]|nr:MAG: 3'-5'-exoribonuclease [Chrysothrix sp. TS-e1954]
MNDRRRVNGPITGSAPPVFAAPATSHASAARTRHPRQLQKIFLRTGVTASASGSAYLEVQSHAPSPSLKLLCSVHGPRPLLRSAPFSSQLVLSTHISLAPFASDDARGNVRSTSERDIGVHLASALRGVILGERFPKSGLDVVVTVMEAGLDDYRQHEVDAETDRRPSIEYETMSILAGCITAASAALIEAGIDCIDLVTGGVAAMSVSRDEQTSDETHSRSDQSTLILDPSSRDSSNLAAACVVGYLASRDELAELWLKGDVTMPEKLIDGAVEAAIGARKMLASTLTDSLPLASSEPQEDKSEVAEHKMQHHTVKSVTHDMQMDER